MRGNHTSRDDSVPVYINQIPARPGQRDVDQDVDLRPTRDLGQGSHVHRQDPNFVAGHADSSYLGYGAYATLDGSRVDSSEFADPDWAGRKLEPERPATPAAARDFTGRGPRNYRRRDARIHEEICELLLLDTHIDASEIDVSVVEGEVLLKGVVEDAELKHLAEDIAYRVAGVLDVTNQLRVGELGKTPAPEPEPQTLAADDEDDDADDESTPRLIGVGDPREDDDLDDLGDTEAQALRARARRNLRDHDNQGPRDTSRSERIGKY